MKKAIVTFLCAALLLSGRQSTAGQQAMDTGAAESGFQKEMNVRHSFRLNAACRTDGGYYLHNEGYIYYMDAAAGRMILLCGRPECSHDDPESCNAWANTKFLTFYDGKLWYTNADAMHDSYLTLCTMEPDGTDHRDVQVLMTKQDFQGWSKVNYEPMLWNGEIFFVLKDNKVCKNRLGGNPRDNVLLLELDTSDKLDWGWSFWGDGNDAYVMCHYVDRDGYDQDVLYLLGDDAEETRDIWHSSELIRGAEKEPSFYITGGHLYYVTAGGFWDVQLDRGDGKKLADVSRGPALFTEQEMLLYSAPDRSIAFYGLDGSRRKEICLTSIYETYSDISSCDPVFADGGMVYLLVYRGGYLSVVSSLFRIDTASGTIQELEDWPAADNELPPQNYEENRIIVGNFS